SFPSPDSPCGSSRSAVPTRAPEVAHRTAARQLRKELTVTIQRRTTRDRLCAAVVVAMPIVLGIGLVLHPRETSNEARQLDIVAHHASAWGAAHVLIYLAAALAIGATAALVRLADRHQAKGALAAGVVAGFGAVALAATAAIELVTRHVV